MVSHSLLAVSSPFVTEGRAIRRLNSGKDKG
jgi:hypothetical protein